MFNLAVICGGPSAERGISLNSARSIMDHLNNQNINIHPIYVDVQKKFYKLSPVQLYSNTPFDFDFKLSETAQKLSSTELIAALKSVNLVFPAIHGAFGEDGELQALLEENNIPFVGHSSSTCKNMFNKHIVSNILHKNNYHTLPSLLINHDTPLHNIQSFFSQHNLNKAVIKPVAGGSSIGVHVVTTSAEVIQKTSQQSPHPPFLLEPFCNGREFTVVVIQNPDGSPFALLPTEIEISYENNQIFNYRRKYLPTANTFYHTPPRFHPDIIQKIRSQAGDIFKLFKMRDFARLDGWILNDNQILFSDLNPISGMEQNSFLFRQSSLSGMSHKQILLNIIHLACQRYNIPPPPPPLFSINKENKKPVFILFGNYTAERQVSLMSGTNVWHKLRQSEKFAPSPFFLDQNHDVWSLPYSFALNHTVEEIYHNCLTPPLCVTNTLSHHPQDLITFAPPPKKYTLEEFLHFTKSENAFLFIALHGDIGENGTLQQLLENYNIPYNGSPPQASALCMDKFLTGFAINSLNNSTIQSLPKKTFTTEDLFQSFNGEQFWLQLTSELKSNVLIIKPRSDGCSAGIIKLHSSQDLETYIHFLKTQALFIPANTFHNQSEIIELSPQNEFIFEPFIQTDPISIENNTLSYIPNTGWLELTVGILEENGHYHALNPSITITSGNILSLEEKFQGGTGINLTPPPSNIISVPLINQIKKSIELSAQSLGIKNYARFDIFFNTLTATTIIIEANSLPALTPSTVLFQQALAESPPLFPTAFLEKLIVNALSQISLSPGESSLQPRLQAESQVP